MIDKQFNIKKSGFSLVEIIIVVAIVALISALGAFALMKIVERQRARDCSGKLLMVTLLCTIIVLTTICHMGVLYTRLI